VTTAPPIAPSLLAWYDRHARILPWRSAPNTAAPDPYRVWLSEVMLQQTSTVAVKPYFEAFTARWPTVQALAAAADSDLMAAWAGLGYYARARNLLACARAVASEHKGVFPDTEAGLLTLPGIGRYTAAAVAAIAFGRRAVVVDGNVERVVSRLFAVETPLPAAKPMLYDLAASITPDDRAGDFAQAMMDLGATICTPRSPACAICPIRPQCAAVKTGAPALYPVRAARKKKPQRYGTIFWLERDGQVLTVRRADKGLLGGMRALPTGPWSDAPPGLEGAPFAVDWTMAEEGVSHVFTHFALDLAIARGTPAKGLGEKGCAIPADGEWWPVDGLDAAGLPTVFAKAARRALEEREHG